MQIINLMEKTEAGAYRILCYLRGAGQAVSIKALAQEVGLSRSTIRKYLALLQESFELSTQGVSLLLKEDLCELRLPADLEWSKLLRGFLTPAIKYQILNYLFRKPSFTIQELAQQLLISEATLHRHLAGLNDILAEFHISIYNGHWQGPEHQIRYLYWLLYRQTWSVVEIRQEVEHLSVQKEVQLVERLCQSELTALNRQSLGLWLAISHQRWSNLRKDGRTLAALLDPYRDNIFFQRLEKACLRYFSRYAVELDEIEAHSLFAFLVSMAILPPHTMSFLLGFGGPVAEQLTQAIQCLREKKLCGFPLPQMVNDVLGKLFHQAYFFQGFLWTFPDEYQLEGAYFQGLVEKEHVDLARSLFSEQFGDGEALTYYRWNFLGLLVYLKRPIRQRLTIGLAMEEGQMMLDLLKAGLDEELGGNPLIDLLPYQSGQAYDGLILSQGYLEQVSCPIYRLSGPLQLIDKERLGDWIQKLQESKKLD
ncbi:helix-turn-helix domain-containing protein [Streptococcus cuniculipharyngis]|uniref:HTH domain-containing protein n=1 Tax=Streptococcus cuniculipharyngis TaxID=1562651 RepID=A0A5C5SE30_9STRE|nr:helix-turn-helix domain-containing protein [Streptococcus cuniculipharyngis]TWS99064.1 HTH domain-containing protein [Streptococcus cuniculipharyngis]